MAYFPLILALLLAACGNYSANVPTLKPYKMDIQQGNVVTPKMMMQLRPGMTKSQVRFIMGTPLLVDSFHGDRWDYFYQMRKDGKIIEQRRVILEFDGDSLSHVRGDVIPAGSDPAAAQPKNTAPRPVVKPAKEKDKGLLDKLKFWGDDEEAKPAQAKPTEPQPAPAKPEAKPEPKPEPKPAPKQEAAPEPAPEPAPAPEAEKTAPAPEPVKAEPSKASAPKPEQTEEKKGWLDKLKFWGDDEKKPAAPAPAPESKPVETPKPAPARVEPKAEPKVEAKPEPIKAEPAKTEPVKAEPRPAAAEPAPAPRRAFKPDSTPKQAPKPPADLPPEDAPEFFEKMLEKIGF